MKQKQAYGLLAWGILFAFCTMMIVKDTHYLFHHHHCCCPNPEAICVLGWQLPQDFYMQPYTDPAKRPATLLWIPDVQSQVMSFSTDGHATVYDVVIEGVTSRGRLIREHTEIVAL